jgi:hypothetical protein
MTLSLMTQTNVYTSGCEILSTPNQLLGEKPHEASPQVVRISLSFRGCGGRDILFMIKHSSLIEIVAAIYLNLSFSVSPKCN